MDEGINSMVDTIHQLESENEKLKFCLSNVSNSLLAIRIEEVLAKYWYDTEYNYIDKSDHKKAEESRARFRKWIDDNLNAFIK